MPWQASGRTHVFPASMTPSKSANSALTQGVHSIISCRPRFFAQAVGTSGLMAHHDYASSCKRWPLWPTLEVPTVLTMTSRAALAFSWTRPRAQSGVDQHESVIFQANSYRYKLSPSRQWMGRHRLADSGCQTAVLLALDPGCSVALKGYRMPQKHGIPRRWWPATSELDGSTFAL